MSELKNIVYWLDGYFIADDDAEEQAEILDSVDAFGSEHKVLEVPAQADQDQIQQMVNDALKKAA